MKILALSKEIRDKFIYQGIIDYKNKKLKATTYVIGYEYQIPLK